MNRREFHNYAAHPSQSGRGWAVVNEESGDEVRAELDRQEAVRLALAMNAQDNGAPMPSAETVAIHQELAEIRRLAALADDDLVPLLCDIIVSLAARAERQEERLLELERRAE